MRLCAAWSAHPYVSAPQPIVAHVIKVAKHPKADRLKVATLDTGAGSVQVVTNAASVVKGMAVILAVSHWSNFSPCEVPMQCRTAIISITCLQDMLIHAPWLMHLAHAYMYHACTLACVLENSCRWYATTEILQGRI